jgi:hypothetical protein
VKHFEDRLAALDGKGMIVCMSRRICVALDSGQFVEFRPPFDDFVRSSHRNRGDREEGHGGADDALGLLAEARSERIGAL